MKEHYKAGLMIAIACNSMWGLLPIFWRQLDCVDAYSILAHRIIWSCILMFIVTLLTQRQRFWADCKLLVTNRKKGAILLGAALLVSLNWLTYIWAVNHGHVMDTSLGYYINPLFSVLLGVVVFKEYLIPAKWISIAIAAIGILVMTFFYGSFPWVSIALFTTFGIYGALKKKLNINPFSSITLETALVTPLALMYVFFFNDSSLSYFQGPLTPTAWLLMSAGVATSVPLVLFSYGANMLPLNVLGISQYLSPTITFFLSMLVFGESFGMAQMIAFTCIWVAVILFVMSEKIPFVRVRTK